MNQMVCIGKKISNLLDEKNMTQRELANRIGVTEVTIGRYINGIREPKGTILSDIAKVLDVSTDYLLGADDMKKPIESKEPTLTKKDIKEIDAYIDALEHDFTAGEGVLFDGEPVDDETLRAFLDTVRIGAEIAKKRNKEKFTPKKYRDQ